jgi:hypothetical protein
MRNKRTVAIAGVLLIILALIFWVAWDEYSRPRTDYTIVSLVAYNQSLCGYTHSGGEYPGYSSGVKFVLKDNDTGKLLDGYAVIEKGIATGGLGAEEKYSCVDYIGPLAGIINGSVSGYTPTVFTFKYPKNQLATVAVSMTKSCSTNASCLDKVKQELGKKASGNQTLADELFRSSEDWFYDVIYDSYGLERMDYVHTCTECDLARGGYIKAKGTYKDGTPMELYYHWGWCSSGGTDCGWSVCFASENKQLFESVKNIACQKLSYYERVEDTSVPGVVSMNTVVDRSNQTITECLSGKYDDKTGNMYALSIIQEANRYATSVEKGDTDCMAN